MEWVPEEGKSGCQESKRLVIVPEAGTECKCRAARLSRPFPRGGEGKFASVTQAECWRPFPFIHPDRQFGIRCHDRIKEIIADDESLPRRVVSPVCKRSRMAGTYASLLTRMAQGVFSA
jgi:hypothetical protein